MKTVDSRVVEASFDGSKFQSGVSKTLDALARLKEGLKLDGATKGLAEINAAAQATDLKTIAESTEHVASKFNVMSAVAGAALTAIVMDATRAGVQITKNLGFGAIMEGWSDYELKVGATQTIMAGTGESIGNVTKHLKELDIYADETIYSLSDMVNNIGKFTNAGVKLPVAVNAMKGISNVAAISGAGTQEAARAMYNLGQAIGQGTVRMMDWRSVELANMGTKQFKEELIKSAAAMGTLKKDTDGVLRSTEGTEVNFKTFSKSLQDGWLTAEALTKTLGRYADENSEIGKASYKAAKDVKTFTMMVTTLKAAMGTGWTDTFDILVGDLPEATKMWTDLTNVVGGAIGRSADARNELLKDWDEMGGRTVLISAISNAFEALMSVIKPLREAFREIFPKQTAEGLFAATVAIQNFFMNLKIGEDTANNLKRTLAGVFAVFGIGFEIIKLVISTIFDLVGAFTEGGSGILGFTGNIGDFLVALHTALVDGGGLVAFFGKLKEVLLVPVNLLRDAQRAISRLFSSFEDDKAADVSDALEKVNERLSPLQKLAQRVGDAFRNLGDFLSNAGSRIADALGGIGDAVAEAFTAQHFTQVLDTINTGLLAAIAYSIKRFFAGGISVNAGGGFLGGIREAVAELTDVMEAMQMKLKAEALLAIAGAIALLTASIVVLSMIDSAALAKAITAMGAGFAVLIAGMIKLEQGSSILGTLKLASLARSMVLIGGALLLVATAMKIFASMSAGDTFQGLLALGGSLVVIAGAMRLMPKNMVGQAAALTMLGIALNAIAVAMKIFGTMDLAETGQALVALGGALVVIAGAMRLMPKNMIGQAAALAILGVALNVIATAMKIFGTMRYDQIARGLVALGGALVIIAGALRLMPAGPNMLLQAVALNAVAVALNVMAAAVMLMGSMGWDAIAKGLVTLGGSLLILAIGLNLMSGTLGGAAALFIAAGALAIFTPVLVTLGNLSWGTILTGLGALVGIFIVLGAAGLLLAPIVPSIMGLGAGLMLLGAGVALAGVGVMAFSMGLSILVGVLKTSGDTLLSWAKTLIRMIPMTLKAIGIGLVEIIKVIGRSGKEFYKAGNAIIGAFLDALIANVPKFGKLLLVMLMTGLAVLRTAVPAIIGTGIFLIMSFLTSIRNNIGKMADLATDAAVEFMDAIGRNVPRLVNAGVDMIIDFINGIANTIRTRSDDMGRAGANMATAIIEGMANGISAGASQVITNLTNMARNALDAAKKALGIKSPSKEFEKVGKFAALGFAKGLVGGKDEVIAAWGVMRALLNEAMDSAAQRIDDYEQRLKELREGKESAKEREQIAKLEKKLSRATKEYNASRDALQKMNKQLDGKHDRLLKLGGVYDQYTVKIEAASRKLKDAIQVRNDYNKSIRDQYDNLPDISEESGLEEYIKNLGYSNDKVALFAQTLQKLRDKGLNDTMYKELLAAGVDALPFAEELLAGGKVSIKQVNDLQSDLAKKAKALGAEASSELYQAGVNSAQGLLDGLKKKRSAIRETMEDIARSIAKALRKELKIKSPSRVTEGLGDMVTRGLASGIKKSAPLATQAAATVSQQALEAMRTSLASATQLSLDEVDANPTITPVLDLSAVQKEATAMTSLFGAQQLAVDASYSRAAVVADQIEALQAAAEAISQPSEETAPAALTFNQYNTSPKALSTGEIYRQTNSQLSKLKGVLTDAAP